MTDNNQQDDKLFNPPINIEYLPLERVRQSGNLILHGKPVSFSMHEDHASLNLSHEDNLLMSLSQWVQILEPIFDNMGYTIESIRNGLSIQRKTT